MLKDIKLIDIDHENVIKYGICGYKNINKPGYPEKIQWIKDNIKNGLKIKMLFSEKDGVQGMIEYIDCENSFRPVEADGYLFIHCIFAGFKKQYKGKGYASYLINECINDAKKRNKNGVAVVTRKGSFMADNMIFLKNGFNVADNAEPDFELLVYKIKDNAATPKFKSSIKQMPDKFKKGLIILRSDQCPYSVKNVNEIKDTAEKVYKVKPEIINLNTGKDAQDSPCAFGTFCIIYNGKIISYHPISNTRFQNIMNKILK